MRQLHAARIVGALLICLALCRTAASGAEIAYVTTDFRTMQAIDTGTNQIISSASVASIGDLAVSADGARLYRVGRGDGIEVIDAASRQTIATVAAGEYGDGPRGRFRLAPDGNTLYVAGDSSQLFVADLVALSATLISLTADIHDVAISPDGRKAYLLPTLGEAESGQVQVMDTATKTVVATIDIQSSPDSYDSFVGGVFSLDGRFLYLPKSYSGAILVVDVLANAISGTIEDDWNPQDIAISPDGQFAYVSHIGTNATRDGGTISVVDLSARSVVARLELAQRPGRVALTADGSSLYVVNHDACSVTVVDTASRTVLTTIAVNEGPGAIALGVAPPSATPTATPPPTPTAAPDAARACAYVTHSSGQVSVIDTHTQLLLGSFAAPVASGHIALKPDGTRAYATGDTTVAVIDTSINAVMDQFVLGSQPGPITLSADGATLYAGLIYSPCYNLYAVDTAGGNISQRFGCTNCRGSSPWSSLLVGLAVSPDGRRAYIDKITGRFGVTSVVDLRSGATNATIAFGDQPRGLALTPDGRTLYVALTSAVGVVDTTTDSVIDIVSLGASQLGASQVWAIAVRPDGGGVYVSQSQDNQTSNRIAVIAPTTDPSFAYRVVASATLEGGPAFGLALTPDSEFAYAAQSNTVSVISTSSVNSAYVSYRVPIPDNAQDIAIGTVPYGCVAPLNPVPTATWTPSSTRTFTRTLTSTPRATRTSTPLPATATETSTVSPTVTATWTRTPSHTVTNTQLSTVTATVTPTATSSSTLAPTSTVTSLPTVTSTVPPPASGGGCALASSDGGATPTAWELLLVAAALLRSGRKRSGRPELPECRCQAGAAVGR